MTRTAHGATPAASTFEVFSPAFQSALAAEFSGRPLADLEVECRLLVKQTALSCLELGKRLAFIRLSVPHGEWLPTLERIGIERWSAAKMMRAAVCFLGKHDRMRVAEAANSKTKLLELLVLDEEGVDELAQGKPVRGVTLAELPTLTVKELRAKLREAAQPEEGAMRGLPGAKGAKVDAATAKCGDVAAFATAPTVPPLKPGDRIRSAYAGRAGAVVRTYDDGSAAVLWDDGEPQECGLAHERMPRKLLDLVAQAGTTETKVKSGVDDRFDQVSTLPPVAGPLIGAQPGDGEDDEAESDKEEFVAGLPRNQPEDLDDIRSSLTAINYSLIEKTMRAGALLRLVKFRLNNAKKPLDNSEQEDLSELINAISEAMPHHYEDVNDPMEEIDARLRRCFLA